jgi:hypothetical protein
MTASAWFRSTVVASAEKNVVRAQAAGYGISDAVTRLKAAQAQRQEALLAVRRQRGQFEPLRKPIRLHPYRHQAR